MKKTYEGRGRNFKRLVLAGLTSLSLIGCSDKESESSIGNFDANGDGVQDVVIFDGENRKYFAFLWQTDGTFKRADIIIQDGIPFYRVENMTYDSRGNSWETNNPLVNYRHNRRF